MQPLSRIIAYISLAVALFCPLFPGSLTAGTAAGDADALLNLAVEYHRQGDLFDAVTEIKRFLHFFPAHPRAGEARLLLRDIQEQPAAQSGGIPGEKKDPAKQNSDPASFLVRFYQNHLRTFRNPKDSCPSYPSCSAYTLQAISKHGPFLGTFIFVDRLWRETTTIGTPPYIYREGRRLHYDPLEFNDYWLGQREKQ